MRAKRKQFISITIKVCVIALVAWFVYSKLHDNQNLNAFRTLIKKLDKTTWYTLVSCLCLMMGGNWLLECVKWQRLCRPIQKISLWEAVESVFCGLSWAIFTPNRIGEYGGRILFLLPRKRLTGVMAMAVGAFAQMVITNVIGSFAFAWLVTNYWHVGNLWVTISWGLATVFSILLIVLYFRVALLYGLIQKIKRLKRFYRFFRVLARYNKRMLGTVFTLSIGRFFIFTMQYGLLMKVLITDLPVFPMFMMVFILFFIQSALPSLDLIDVGVRSLTAGYLFAFITTQELAVMASAAAIWFINLIVPAIIGSFFVLKLNIFGRSYHE